MPSRLKAVRYFYMTLVCSTSREVPIIRVDTGKAKIAVCTVEAATAKCRSDKNGPLDPRFAAAITVAASHDVKGFEKR